MCLVITRSRNYCFYRQSICHLQDHSSEFQAEVIDQTQKTLLAFLALTWLRSGCSRKCSSSISEASDTQAASSVPPWSPQGIYFGRKVVRGLMRVWVTWA